MKDCRSRDIKENDVLLVTYSNLGLFEIGTLIGDKIRTLSTINRASSSCTCYILTNPTQEELDERDEIINAWERKLNKRKIENKGKKEYGKMLGGVYSTKNDDLYLYLGNLRITEYQESKLISDFCGNCYKYIGNSRFRPVDIESISNDFFSKNWCQLQANKGFKQVTGLYGIHSRFKMSDYRDIVGTYEFKYYDYENKTYKTGTRVVELNI